MERRRSLLIKVDPKLGNLANSEPDSVAQRGLFGEPFIKEVGNFVNTVTSLDKAQSSIRKVFHPRVFRGAGRGRGRSPGRPNEGRGQGSGGGHYQDQARFSYFYPTRGR